ncbi:MAG TPA: hypothetical protein VNA69_18960 [Thermoanaerobaculia bacterium]|nr:hypothetical protein [Thermoanaerobaculia bacterium]
MNMSTNSEVPEALALLQAELARIRDASLGANHLIHGALDVFAVSLSFAVVTWLFVIWMLAPTA